MKHFRALTTVRAGAVVALAGAALLVAASAAPAAIFYNTLVPGTVNTYEDQDRESIVDIDGDGAVSVGDVFFGWVRFDDRSQPLPGQSTSADLYGVFTFELQSVTPTPIGATQTRYDFVFGATTSAAATALGLDLASLIGPLPALEAGSPVGAFFEDVAFDLVTTSPGDFNGDGAFNMFDFTSRIAAGNLDLVAGFGGGATEADDHWFSDFTVPNASDPIANLALLNAFTLSGGTPGTNGFHSGLSILYDSSAAWSFLEMVPDFVEGVPPSFHELTVQNAGISGASDLTYGGVNPFFFTIADAAGNQYNAYGVSSNADFNVYGVVIPEPGTMILLGSGLLGLAGVSRRKKT